MKQPIKQGFYRSALATAIAAVSTGSIFTVPQVFAQESGPIEEIVVTATSREASMQDIPYNISAVSGDNISAAQITDQAELMRNIPGVAVVDRGSRNSGVINGIMIRGLNVDGAALGDYALAASPTVSTYVDSTPVYANFILKDLERVEVLRGPQGTLYGSGSLGGTVRYITRAPSTEAVEVQLNSGVSSTAGSSGLNYFSDAIINIPLADNIAVRGSAGFVDSAGVVDYVNVYQLDNTGLPVAPNGVLSADANYRTVKDADTVDIKYVKVAALWQPTEKIEAVLTHMMQQDDIGGRRQQTVGMDGFGNSYDEYENGSVQLEPSSREADLTSLEVDIDLGFATLTSSTSQYDHVGESVSENTGFYAQLGWLGQWYYNYTRPMAEAARQYEDSAFIQELRLVSSTSGNFDWTLGAFHINQDTAGAQQSYLRGFDRWAATAWGIDLVATDQDWDYSRMDEFTENAVYGEATWHMDKLHFTLGARYFDNEYQSDVFMDLPLWGPGVIGDAVNERRTTSDNGTLFKGNLSYDINEDTMVYATVSEGYRRGGTNAVPLSGNFAESDAWLEYDSDAVLNTELGIKGNLGNARYTLAAFMVDWQDVQMNTSTPVGGFYAVANGESASTSGLEFEIQGSVTETLSYGIGYAYVNAELDDALVSPTGGLLASAGTRLPGTPEHTLSAALDYRAPIGNQGLELIARLASYYQSDTQNAASDSVRFAQTLDGFAIVDGHVGIAGDWWSATLFAKNLANAQGSTGIFKEEYMGTDPSQNYFGNGSKEFLALPRTIGANLKVTF
ncbi:TonB-dependent receptor [Microbulbifer sp. CAU 1566]|uniref:TonB-dependent receptor n=1 Tax=Microbulbifer sp. CAU 1566 TaxID=2933269 RepID=UPI002004B272|nr:TonB-dependent receptor [Microbulbifer sp. CAU 1566]MCK7598922.1 TonB-dependent receptor [Microbulbifer sp. CAU 1566]